MKKAIVIISLCFIFGLTATPTRAQGVIDSPGDIAFTGFNADGYDDFAFVLLADAPGGLVINFTDNEWNGTNFTSGEGIISWTVPPEGLPVGTVVNIFNAKSDENIIASIGFADLVTLGFDIGGTNDEIYAYLGLFPSPTVVLAAIGNEYDAYDQILNNSGLTSSDIILIDGDADIMAYYFLRNNLYSADEYRLQINNSSNWVTQNTSQRDDIDGEFPDVPFDTTPFTTPTAIRLLNFNAQTFDPFFSLFVGFSVITALFFFRLSKRK